MAEATSGAGMHRRRTGQAGESAAARWYEAAGYRVVERNWRCRHGEIDLILHAPRNGALVFCEVKTRRGPGFGYAAEAVTRSKQLRIRRLAAIYLAECAHASAGVRFDVASVENGAVEVIEGAF